eukprot:CAMPEP_0175966338 /NCGR_PEP_ID=MMETSP0108-20121206/38625_1 /TAXON_ID=195067 ORGANISM="Goniomonas pacifica, Strain CCMP1869" /NCGR_SAMPLE_ID=MMETSP0108 /ASSEMBLY_ACC=CAM_ASM_000204 /LENGTH=133 /DNA_ID=CAMNT_0017294547 /DNA_START=8 /DNA_END=409 /DNA_ORIENTATION=-
MSEATGARRRSFEEEEEDSPWRDVFTRSPQVSRGRPVFAIEDEDDDDHFSVDLDDDNMFEKKYERTALGRLVSKGRDSLSRAGGKVVAVVKHGGRPVGLGFKPVGAEERRSQCCLPIVQVIQNRRRASKAKAR